MNNDFWNKKGCDKCRADALLGGGRELKKVAEKGLLFLHQCSVCGTYWEENPREMHPIEASDVTARFPEYKKK